MAERTRVAVVSRPARPKVPTAPKPMTPTQRKTLANQKIVNFLGASSQGKETNSAITAALEIISDRLAYDTDIQQTLRQKYGELEALDKKPPKPDLGPEPIPISGSGLEHYNPYAKFDPYVLLHDYGRDQLRAVLLRATSAHLREAVGIVKEHNPGTKPTDGRSNAGMIDYIVEYVVGPRH
ncbi:MAG: hypothetical protein ACLQUY_15030 [Ktedonobacterales bacterium]